MARAYNNDLRGRVIEASKRGIKKKEMGEAREGNREL